MAKYYGNKVSHIVHSSKKNDACRAAEIKASNRKTFNDLETAKVAGYRPCRLCVKD